MSQRLDLTHDGLFKTMSSDGRFRTLVKKALSRGACLCLDLGEDGAGIELRDAAPDAPALEMAGRWSSADLARVAVEGACAKTLAPLVHVTGGLRLQAGALSSMPHDYRSVGTFFMRNVFLVMSRGDSVAFTAAEAPSGKVTRTLREQYFYVLKAHLDDPLLKQRSALEAMDLIVSNTHCALNTFSDPVLRVGTARLRRGLEARRGTEHLDLIESDLLAARARVMAHFT